jgi:nucleoside-triphosphatase THEP1
LSKKLDRNITKAIPHPKCPTLAWIIAKRVTNSNRTMDCTVMITGKKGSGKSTFSMNLAYEISKCIAVILHKEELKTLSGSEYNARLTELAYNYFNMDHVKSVDKEGTMELFSGDIMKKYHAVIICDDVSIAANSRNSMTSQNKAITEIMTVSRPYKHVTIMNTVYSTLIDKNARNFSDIVIDLLFVDEKRKRSVCKAFIYSVNQNTGREYRKFFTWHGKRIKYWFCGLPPKYFNDAYTQLRLDKTNEMIDERDDKRIERKEKGHKREIQFTEALNTYKTQIERMIDEANASGKKYSIRAMTRLDPLLTREKVEKIIAVINKERGVK